MSKKRNKLGDVEMPKISSDFQQKEHERRITHVFQFKDDRGIYMPVDYDGIPKGELDKGFPEFELVTVGIFKSPEKPPWDEWIDRKGKYEHYLAKYFRPVLSEKRGLSNRPIDIDKVRMIMPKDRYESFKKFISEYKLTEHEDFILFLLAKIEEVYLDDVEFHERPEQRKRIKNFPKEIESLITALKLSSRDLKRKTKIKRPPELKQVTFHFDTEKSIKITDPMLVSSITDATRNEFDNHSMKDWEKQLRAFPSVYTANQQPNEFRYRICKALHNFFKGVSAFEFGENETTDAEVYAIAWMLDFAHVKFSNKRRQEYDIVADKYELRQVVRLHIHRKELVYKPTHYSAEEFKPDIKNLLRYFKQEFIQAGSPFYKEHDIRQIFTITNRFGVTKVFPELLQIFTSLDSYRTVIGHQFEAPFNPEIINTNNDYRAMKSLLDILKVQGRIEKLEFKIEGNENQFSFSETSTLEIMKEAIREYHENHRPEFEVDFYQSKVDIQPTQGGFSLVPSGKLNLPGDRFLPDFVTRCYDFLLKEVAPGEHDWMPSEKYYGVIAILLIRSWYFGTQMVDERSVINQVKYWHNLKTDFN